MNKQKEILKEILDNIPKTDFKEIYAGGLYRRLEKETDPDVKKLFQEKIYSIQVTDENKSVLVVEKVKEVTEQLGYGLVINEEGTCYLYNKVFWEPINELDLKHFLGKAFQKMGADKYTARNVRIANRIHEQACYSLYKQTERDKGVVKINLTNTTLVIGHDGSVKEQEHSADDYFFYVLPYEYAPKAMCPMFQKFLDEVLPEKDVQEVLQEFVGCCLNPFIKLEKVLCCIGTGANGKSVFFETIMAVLGENNVSSYNINSLCDDKGYSRIMIKNKLLNYSSDFNGKIWGNGIFKQLASGEPVEARQLYQDPEMVKGYARLAFNCNSIPTSSDSSYGFRRRLLMIPFGMKISKEKADPDLARKLLSELPGILLWAIEGLQRFIRNGKKLSSSPTIEALEQEYKEDTDSVVMFLGSKHYIPGDKDFKRLSELYNEYKEYCKSNSIRFESKSNLKNKLKEEGYTIEEKEKKLSKSLLLHLCLLLFLLLFIPSSFFPCLKREEEMSGIEREKGWKSLFYLTFSILVIQKIVKKIGFIISPPRFPLLSFLREGRRKCEIKNIKI